MPRTKRWFSEWLDSNQSASDKEELNNFSSFEFFSFLPSSAPKVFSFPIKNEVHYLCKILLHNQLYQFTEKVLYKA